MEKQKLEQQITLEIEELEEKIAPGSFNLGAFEACFADTITGNAAHDGISNATLSPVVTHNAPNGDPSCAL